MKYLVYGRFYASKFIGEFEANSPEEAREIAESSDNNYVSLCHQCAGEIDLNEMSAYEFDVEELG